MLIRSKLYRPGGTRVVLGKGKDARHYHFKPIDPKANAEDPAIDHVCDINDADDVATFVAIKEGYEIHASELKKPSVPPAPPKQPSDGKNAPVAGVPGSYGSMKKPDLIRLVAQRTGKQPHGTTSTAKLVATLEELDKASA